MMRIVAATLAATVALSLAALDGGGIAAQGGATGTIEGHVRLTGPAPANPLIRMGMDPMCGRANAGRRQVQQIVVKDADGGLANVFVDLEGTFPAVPPPSAPVVITQRGCIYIPRVVGAQVGQTLRIVNEDPLLHNLHSVSREGNEFNVSQPKAGMVFNFTLKGNETMLRVKCDVHSWMTSYIGVLDHPYFAVSSEAGSFTIARVPAGRRTIVAWHERYGRLTRTVDVKAGAATTVEFAYTGTEKPASAALHELLIPAV